MKTLDVINLERLNGGDCTEKYDMAAVGAFAFSAIALSGGTLAIAVVGILAINLITDAACQA